MAFPMFFTLNIFVLMCVLQVNCKVEKYAFNVVENGKNINEQVEIDEEENTEVIRVPKHDDVNEVNLLNDCTGRFSARRDAENKVCYVSKLDSCLTSPKEMKQEMDQVSNQTQSTEVTTESSEWQVVGLADLSALPPKILDFCGTLPIYEIEEKENPSDNTALGQTRSKRSTGCYNICSSGDYRRMRDCRRRGARYNCFWKCQSYRRYCYYRYKCYPWGCICYRICCNVCYKWCKSAYCSYYGSVDMI